MSHVRALCGVTIVDDGDKDDDVADADVEAVVEMADANTSNDLFDKDVNIASLVSLFVCMRVCVCPRAEHGITTTLMTPTISTTTTTIRAQ